MKSLTRQKARQLGQRHLVNTALELHHHIQRDPVIVPTPGVELRVVSGAQVQMVVVGDQLQQVPDLFLALVKTACIPADEAVWHLIAQPVTGPGHDAHMLRVEPHFFMEFAEHGLFRTFAPVNATLRKLPAVGADALAPENLVFLVEQNDADVRPKAFTVKHNQPQIFKLHPLCTARRCWPLDVSLIPLQS